MNHEWKREFHSIPVPSELHQRSLTGIQRAQAEMDETFSKSRGNRTYRLTRKPMFATMVVGLLVIILAFTVFQPQVIAGIQRILQFVPGIGIVKQEDQPVDRYILKQTVTVQHGKGQIIVTGIMVDEEMTYLTMAGNLPSQKPEEIILVSNEGTEFVIKRSMSSWTTNQWSSDYWYRGKLDVQDGSAKIIIEQLDRLEISLTLVKAETFGSYEEMGETAYQNDISITTIASKDGSKGRLSFISQQPSNIEIVDYGFHGIHNGHTFSLTDSTGNMMEIEKIPGISGPAKDFRFNLNQKQSNEIYTLQIPEINVRFKGEATIKVPTQSVDNLNKTFTIAGFPVTITRTERIDDHILRLYLDLHFNESENKSLHRIELKGMGHSGRLNEHTGAYEYIEVDIDPGLKEKKLTIIRPEVLVRGPWTFQFRTDKYFQP